MNGELLAGRYRLLDLLGRGGAGEVWRAEDEVLARTVAVKLLRPLDGDPVDAAERFRIEAQAAARLTHPNVVATYDVAAAGDQVFLVMELVHGNDLAHLLRTKGMPGPKLVADIAVQGARALDAAHAAGIVHRDIKPGNLLLAEHGTLKMTDFGLARAAGVDGATGPVLLGTAAYISPEQVRGAPATPASDWYSLGCVLHELLTGAPPFTADTLEGVLRQHLETTPPTVRRTDAPPALLDLVNRLLAKDPAERPTSAAEVIGLLSGTALAADRNTTRVLPLMADSPEPTARLPLEPPTTEPGGDTARSRIPRSPLAKVIAGLAMVVAAVAAVVFVRGGLSGPGAEAGGVPSPTPTVAPRTTPAPKPVVSSSTTEPRPTPKPSAKPKPKSGPAALRALAGLLRQSAPDGRAGRAVREAAKEFDEAADKLADGKPREAAQKVREAQRRLVAAQRTGEWRPTAEMITLMATVSRTLAGADANDDRGGEKDDKNDKDGKGDKDNRDGD